MYIILWLIVYLIVSKGAHHGGPEFDPINWWAGTLILAAGLDFIGLRPKVNV